MLKRQKKERLMNRTEVMQPGRDGTEQTQFELLCSVEWNSIPEPAQTCRLRSHRVGFKSHNSY